MEPLNFSTLKKFLYVLFAIAAVLTGCKKDTSTLVNITASDLTTINNQLKGTWLFPIGYQRIIEPASGAIDSVFYAPAPALQFDGGSAVNILQDTKTTIKGTYSLSTKKGMIYVDVTYPNGDDVLYQVLSVNAQTLKLESTTPYAPINQETTSGSGQMLQSDVTMTKQTGADVSGHLIHIVVKSDKSYYSVSVSVTHTRLPAPADSTILLNSKINTLGNYTYEFMAKSGDQLYVDVLGDYAQTSFYAFYDGIPMAGNIGYDFQEIKTTTGWMVP